MILTKSKIFFISNRLPFSVKAKTGTLQRGSGGLVTALLGVHLEEPFCWLGFETDHDLAAQLREKASQVRSNMQLEPVVLERRLYDSYYDKFCNDVLWPLFHYEGQHVLFRREDWHSYVEANRRMAEAILKLAGPEDTVWIHDFHFMMLPEMLKKSNPSLKVGFFLHTPFPSSEIFRQLPVRNEILQAMTNCDLVGFHEHAYLRHFTVALKAQLGIDSTFFKADLGDHVLRFGVYPISIDGEEMRTKAFSKPVSDQLARYRSQIQSEFLALGVDRLDYSKGIELKLKGFRRLLQKYPDLRGRVNLLQVAVPTRTKVPAYIRLKKEIDQLIGTINGEFGQPGYVPVHYIFNSVGENELLALYRRADCALITSKRDGMNLVAMEYAVCQSPKTPGTIVLSEFVGAASLLGESIFINPWDEDSVADALYSAFHMPHEEKKERLRGLQEMLSKYSATRWAQSFITDLEGRALAAEPQRPTVSLEENEKNYPEIFARLSTAEKCCLVVDYDGTLVALQKRPELAVADKDHVKFLYDLQKYFDIYIVSGRNQEFLDQQFPKAPFHLVAEHGAYFKEPGARWKSRVGSDISSWYGEVKRVMKAYTDKVPLSFVESKKAALVWHYRQSPVDFAEYQARKLDDELQSGLANQPVEVTIGSKIVEARAIECNKGAFVRWLRERSPENTLFICIGDDRTDEDMFRVLERDAITVKVGPQVTHAQFRLAGQERVITFMQYLKKQRSLHTENKTK